MIKTLATCFLACATTISLSARAAAPSIERLFSSHAQSGAPALSVAVVQDGKLVYHKTFGFSDIENAIAADSNSRFEIGSVSKMFTALAVERLIAAAELSGADSVRKYLPSVPDYFASITVRELLQHTSGIRDYFELMAMQGIRFEDSVAQDDVMGLIVRQKEINFPPGTDYNYTNSEYVLLAKVVEKVSGQPFADYVAETVFAPLGMRSATFHANRVTPIPHKAQSYISVGPGRVIALPFNSDVMGPSGAWMTTLDLSKWLIYLDKAVASHDAAATGMAQPAILAGGKELASGEGVFRGAYRGYANLYHDGGDCGYRSVAMLFPGRHLGIAIEANSPTDDLMKLSEAIADSYLPASNGPDDAISREVAANVPAGPTTDNDLHDLAGFYRSEELDTSYTLRVDGGRLIADHIRNGEILFTPLGKDAWLGDSWWRKSLNVERNQAGQVTGFRLAGFRSRRGILFQRLR
jgi:CubicO group peptidase (beta-lactamase class C family)